jgi:hypothetical protein
MRLLLSTILCLMFTLATGCGAFDSAKTVEVEISGVDGNPAREEILEVLSTMYDKDAGSKRMHSSSSHDVLKVKMSPVSDVQAFSRRINFGTVEQVADRTVKVRYVPRGEILETV